MIDYAGNDHSTLLLMPDLTPEELELIFPTPEPLTTGQIARKTRRSYGVTQMEFARAAGVTFKDVSDMENDRSEQGAAHWKILAALLQIQDGLR